MSRTWSRRTSAALMALTLTACSGPTGGGGGIVSTNPCLDAILVELVPPERIASISHYSWDPRSTSMDLAVARRLPATAGTAEEVLALRPELVLASSFTQPATLAAYRRLGLKVEVLPIASTVAENRAQIRAIARATGAERAAEALIGRIDRALSEAAPVDARRPAALMWLGESNLVNGQGTLIDELMTKAGFRNASSDYGVRFTGALPLEHVIAAPPEIVMTPTKAGHINAEARRVDLRLRALDKRTKVAAFPPNLVYCGGPSIVPAMERLAEIRRQVAR